MKIANVALVAAAAFGFAGTAVAAEGPAWTYAQLGYFRADNLFGDDDTDGLNLTGSLGLGDMFHVQAQYVDGTIGSSSGDSDFDGYRFIAGIHQQVSDSTDVLVNVQYFDLSYDDVFLGSGPDADVDGFGLGAGIRHMLTDKVELNAIAWWNDGDIDPDGSSEADVSDSVLEFGGRYLFTDNLSVGVTFINNDTVTFGDSATLDVRWQFDDIL